MNFNKIKRMLSAVLTAAMILSMPTGAFAMPNEAADSKNAELTADFDLDLEHPVMSDRKRPEGFDQRIIDYGDAGAPAKGEETLPASYAIPVEYLPYLRNQDNFGSCWAHGAMASVESRVLKKNMGGYTRETIDFSELNLAAASDYTDSVDPLGGTAGDINLESLKKVNNQMNFPDNADDPAFDLTEKKEVANWLNMGGTCFKSSRTLMGWRGTVKEAFSPYYIEANAAIRTPLQKWTKWMAADPSRKEQLSKYYDAANNAAIICAYENVLNKHEEIHDTYQNDRPVFVTECEMFPKVETEEERNKLKKLIMENGIIDISYYSSNGAPCVNDKKYAYFCAEKKSANHEVAVVGWDDNYDKSNFRDSAKIKNNGAWLFRNSWESDPKIQKEEYPVMRADGSISVNATADGKGSINGYFWISYEDKTICDIAAYDVKESTAFDNNYQYDGGSYNAEIRVDDTITGASVFTAKANDKGEIIKAVNVYTGSTNADLTVRVFRNPKADDPMTGKEVTEAKTTKHIEGFGGYTIELNEPVYLKKGDTYAVAVTVDKPGDIATIAVEYEYVNDGYRVSALSGQSFLYADNSVIDYGGRYHKNLCVKAYTKNQDLSDLRMINYVLGNGADTDNPYCYKPGTISADGIPLKAPKLSYGEFEGWYLDAAYTEPVDVIAADSDADITLYAKIKLDSIERNGSRFYINIAPKQKVTIPEIAKTASDGKDYKIWINSDEKKIATVNNKGVVAGKKHGNIYVEVATGKGIYGLYINVLDIGFAEKQYTMNSGDELKLSFEARGMTPEFSISEKQKSLANVDPKTGVVSALNGVKGTVTVTATIGEGKGAYKAACKVRIYDPVLSYKSEQVAVGKALKLSVKNGVKTTEWSVVNETGKATIDAKGKLVGEQPGTVTVTAINNGRRLEKQIRIVE